MFFLSVSCKIGERKEMKIIGIKLIKGEDAVIKNLKKDTWYPFGDYNEPTEENGWQWLKNSQEDTHLNELYRSSTNTKFPDKFKLSVCCVVGKNGAGKSTLFDLMFRIINNFAYFLLEKKLEEKKGEENPQKGRELAEANGYDASLYFETDENLGIIRYNYGKLQYDYYDSKQNYIVTELFDGDISNKRMHDILNDFFYTICTNYSIHSFIEDDYDTKGILEQENNWHINGDWIRGVLHKNDGYLTPIVIVPYRYKDGKIDVVNEETLAIQRLSVLAVLLWSQNKFLLDEYKPVAIEYVFDENSVSTYSKKLTEILDKKLPLNIFDHQEFSQIYSLIHDAWRDYLESKKWYKYKKEENVDFRKAVLNYLCYKTVKICTTYRSYGVKLGVRAVTENEIGKYGVESGALVAETTQKEVKELVEELANDKTHTHITLKLHQCLAFLKRGYYKATIPPPHFNLSGTGELIEYHNESINSFFKDNIEIDNKNKDTVKKRYETYDEAFLEMPPSIFKWEVKLSHKRKRESLSLKGMSSGEKHMLQSASYLLYHIKNIEKITIDKYRTPYHHVNIVMDEAELYYHPEFQRQLIANMVDMLAACHFNGNIIRSVNLMIATHSPFVLSDIPNSRTLYLKDGAPEKRVQQTFAANYHELLYNQFFINNTMGEVGIKAIQDLMEYYKAEGTPNLEKNRRFDKRKAYFRFVVDMIGDNYLRNSLIAILDEIEAKIKTYEEGTLSR